MKIEKGAAQHPGPVMTPGGSENRAPATGDDTPAGPWLACLSLAVSALALLLIRLREHRRS